MNPVSTVIGFIVAVAAAVWLVWCTVIAFTGGTLPLLGWEIGGGLLFGLFWVFIIDPIAATVAFWVGSLIALPFVAISESATRTR